MSKKACDKKKYKEPSDAKFYCKKCDRAAIKKKKLCKPKPL